MNSFTERIDALRRDRRAIILAHYYQRPEVQALADCVGDSLELARRAAGTDAEVIVFCGVHFMAETAAILNPDKTVLLPDLGAGCPMAEMVTPEALGAWKVDHPDAVVVTYVNSTAAVKALSDVCCTSSNALEVVSGIEPGREILFCPDRNLGHWVRRQVRRQVTVWNGWCPTHQRILPEHVAEARLRHPAAAVVVHPECRPEVVDLADEVASTSGILRICGQREEKEFIIGTENGFLDVLRLHCPEKRFYPASELAGCPNMKRITPEKVLASLETLQPTIAVPRPVAAAARLPLKRMLSFGQTHRTVAAS